MTDRPDKITAPWTPKQVDALNAFQRLGFVHPFTCPHDHDGADRDLVATKDGWICPHCDYRQDWAHESMLHVTKDSDPTKAWHTAAERERCAKIADAHAERCLRGSSVSSAAEDSWGAVAARAIAKAIREQP